MVTWKTSLMSRGSSKHKGPEAECSQSTWGAGRRPVWLRTSEQRSDGGDEVREMSRHRARGPLRAVGRTLASALSEVGATRGFGADEG